jgi:non-ribosomal peptide synthase protein (TIGR01720 family)
LRYLAGDESAGQLADLPEPQISFNYLGQFDQALPREAAFAPAQEARGPDRDPRGPRSTLLEVTGSVVGGCLRVEWTYSTNQYDDLTIDWLAQDYIAALRELIAHCQSPEAGSYTPSDFGLATLDQRQLDQLVRRFG